MVGWTAAPSAKHLRLFFRCEISRLALVVVLREQSSAAWGGFFSIQLGLLPRQCWFIRGPSKQQKDMCKYMSDSRSLGAPMSCAPCAVWICWCNYNKKYSFGGRVPSTKHTYPTTQKESWVIVRFHEDCFKWGLICFFLMKINWKCDIWYEKDFCTWPSHHRSTNMIIWLSHKLSYGCHTPAVGLVLT